MKITIETYRILIFIFLASVFATATKIFVELPFNPFYLSVPAILIGLYGAAVAITNVKRGAIRAVWKKENKELTIPFQNGSLSAYDEDGVQYELGMFMLPKRVE